MRKQWIPGALLRFFKRLGTRLTGKVTHINMCIYKSLSQAFESSNDVTPPAVLSTLVPSPVEIQSQPAKQMHTWTAKNWMQHSMSHVLHTLQTSIQYLLLKILATGLHM